MRRNEYGLNPKVYARLYASWKNIIRRCTNPTDKEYKNYGGRGITICNEWAEFHTYAQWALSNGWGDGMSIERIDVNGNYEPSNCTFIPIREQFYNKTNTAWITHDGKTQSLAKWCEELGLNKHSVSTRRNRDKVADSNELFAPPQSRCKAILQILEDGTVVEYPSINEASKATGIGRRNISNVLNHWSNLAGGYKWKYKEDIEICSS